MVTHKVVALSCVLFAVGSKDLPVGGGLHHFGKESAGRISLGLDVLKNKFGMQQLKEKYWYNYFFKIVLT